MKQPRTLFYSLLIATVAILLHSCKKEEIYPEVKILSPTQGTYNYGDTIVVRATADKVSGNVSVSVLKGSRLINLPSDLVYQNDNNYEFEIYFDDKYLESGEYDIRLRAFNEGNGSSTFEKIYLRELPKRIRGFVALSKNGSVYTLTKLDSISNANSITLNGDHNHLSVSSRFGQVIVAPEEMGQLTAYGYNDLAEDYKVSLSISNTVRLYEDLTDVDGFPSALTSDGRIRKYNSIGTILRSNQIQPDHVGKKMSFYEDKFAILGLNETNNRRNLFIVDESTYAVFQTIPFAFEDVSMEWYNNSNCVIAYRQQNRTIIANYDLITRSITRFGSLENIEVYDIEWANGVMLLATDDGIYGVNPDGQGGLVKLYSDVAFEMRYDDLNQETYYITRYTVFKAALNMPWQYVYNSLNGEIIDFEIAYNK